VQRLDRQALWSLEEYATRRDAFRAEVIAHKRPRRIALGAHATIAFEDFTTMKYQVQEMLRTERIFEPAEIDAEIAAYDPLIPDGRNWKATFLIEYEDVDERREMLEKLTDIERQVWVRVAGHPPVYAIANEDLERTRGEKTAAVHFLRFELNEPMAASVATGAAIAIGIDHPRMTIVVDPIPAASRGALARDLD
jgi:uncharacterized protein DUF3501